MKYMFIKFAVVVIGIALFLYVLTHLNILNSKADRDVITQLATTETVQVEAEPKYQISEFIVENGEVFASIMERMGFSYSDAMTILDSASTTYDFTSIRVGRPFHLYKNASNENVKLEYEKNSEEIVEINLLGTDFNAKITPIQYQIETQVLSGVVSSSLWMAGVDAGMPDDLIIKFANIFDWTVDFAMGVQKGDSFELLYEKRFRDGKYVGTGKVLAGKFVNNGRTYFGYLFPDANGDPAYYNEKGESMRKQFLRAPLEYRYISSGFSGARPDPISGVVGGHYAIDYAAALGTPVRAVGDGVVEFAGWNGGFGNLITIHHNGTYTTQYGHLSAYAKNTKKGAKVVQGQVIGFVGSTGHSTGPHLHYQIRKNGQLVNALTIEFPPGESVATERRADFDLVRANYDKYLHF